jgi:hypothetical protein
MSLSSRMTKIALCVFVAALFSLTSAWAQNWIQLAPVGTPPPAGGGVGGLDQINNRMVIVYPNGDPQTSWVLTNADGLGGTPVWLSFVTLPDPVNGSAPSRGELPTAVYDAASNRVITFAGCTGNCGSATNDVWVLTNANGLSGIPSWLKLAPSGPLPQPRASQSAAYDPGTNRMIVFGGQDGCCAQQHSFGDVWVLTNANGLGGTPAWIQLSTAGGPPPGQSGMTVVYDAASNRMMVFGGFPYASNVPTNAVWVLSNANGLGGVPTWTILIPEGSSGSPAGRGYQGAVYDPPTNRMIVFAGLAPPTNTLYNDTWALSGANGTGPAAWTQLSTMGGPPGARDVPLAVLNASSNRMTIWGGGGATGSFNDVWVLTNANGTGGGCGGEGTLTLFCDNFNSYSTSVGLAGQGGWFQDSSNTAPIMLSTTTPLGPSVAVDGLHRTGTGAYNGTSFALVRHTLSGPLNPIGISILSVDAYAFNAYMSHASGIGLTSTDSTTVNITAYAAWYASHSPAWQFNNSFNGLETQNEFFYGAFDQPIRLEIVIDGGAGTFYDRLVYSGGVYETPHHAITSAQIADVTQVILFEDFRDVYLGVDLDNVLVTTTVSTAGTTLSFTAGSATTSDFNDAAQVQAKLTTTGGVPVPNETVTFTLGSGSGAPTCSATTDATGTATCLITPNQAAGPVTLTATFAGDALFGGSSASTTFTVTKEETTLKFTASSPTMLANGQSATFSATLKEDGTTPISGRSVMITLGNGGGAQSCTGTSNSSGTASCTIVVNEPLGPNTVAANFSGDAFYRPSSDKEAVVVFAFLGSGSFVIGDLNAAMGSSVTFWGAQWAKSNSLSGGPAPNAFKGFADSAPQTCGGSWTSDPGNSSKPPDNVPSYMAVIASSSISKSGPTISGNVPRIVIVQTNPGYGPAPGHTGTGTVVAVFCGGVI